MLCSLRHYFLPSWYEQIRICAYSYRFFIPNNDTPELKTWRDRACLFLALPPHSSYLPDFLESQEVKKFNTMRSLNFLARLSTESILHSTRLQTWTCREEKTTMNCGGGWTRIVNCRESGHSPHIVSRIHVKKMGRWQGRKAEGEKTESKQERSWEAQKLRRYERVMYLFPLFLSTHFFIIQIFHLLLSVFSPSVFVSPLRPSH